MTNYFRPKCDNSYGHHFLWTTVFAEVLGCAMFGGMWTSARIVSGVSRETDEARGGARGPDWGCGGGRGADGACDGGGETLLAASNSLFF